MAFHDSKMQYRQMGRSGLKLSLFSIGSWVTYGKQVDAARTRTCLLEAYEHGVNYFDHAEAYAQGQAELTCGRVLAELRREDLVISSKVFWGGQGPNDRGLGRKHVVEACHAALGRLQTDYLDLFFCHRPDPATPVEEIVRTMNRLIAQGKVLYWGTSEWSAAELQEAWLVADRLGLEGPAVEQPQYNLFVRERVEVEYQPLYEQRGMGTTTWSPLLSGILSGKYDHGIPEGTRLGVAGMEWLQRELTEERREQVRRLAPLATELGCSRAQLALAWCARNPQVSTVITGASRPGQVVENLGALAVLDRMDQEVLARIDAALAG